MPSRQRSLPHVLALRRSRLRRPMTLRRTNFTTKTTTTMVEITAIWNILLIPISLGSLRCVGLFLVAVLVRREPTSFVVARLTSMDTFFLPLCPQDPFHILLMGSTFEKPKITVPYVAGSLEYVLQMPPPEAETQSKFARDEGMACLGTWTREECLSLGRQLQRRDLECRVVPFCQGGQRSWQARDAKAAGGVTSE